MNEQANSEQSDSLKPMTPVDLADDVIGLFLEYRDVHGYAEDQARAKAIQEVAEAEQARAELEGK